MNIAEMTWCKSKSRLAEIGWAGLWCQLAGDLSVTQLPTL